MTSILDEILTIRKHWTAHDATIDYQEERKLNDGRTAVTSHLFKFIKFMTIVYPKPEKNFLEFINKVLYLRQMSFALLKRMRQIP